MVLSGSAAGGVKHAVVQSFRVNGRTDAGVAGLEPTLGPVTFARRSRAGGRANLLPKNSKTSPGADR